MQQELLQVSQYVLQHPIMDEKKAYKKRYINTIEYFVRKYSANDDYANAALKLYIKKLMEQSEFYDYQAEELKKISRGVMGWKMKKFKFFSYRYCLLADVFMICAVGDKAKAEEIYHEIIEIYSKRYWKKLQMVFDGIYNDGKNLIELDQLSYVGECIYKNLAHMSALPKRILVTANMSAGKSTLLNALIGKKVNKTQNDVCTSKIHHIMNKAFEDELTYKYDANLNLDTSIQDLLEDDRENRRNDIYVGTKFRSLSEVDERICFIDTPGVNSSRNADHSSMSNEMIKSGNYDLMLFVLNSQNIGTKDDKKHMEFVAKNYNGKVIFLVNKLDAFNGEDSVSETVAKVKEDVEKLGFQEAEVYPISAQVAMLAKRDLFYSDLDEFEKMQLEILHSHMSEEEFNFDKYYPIELDITCEGENKKDIELLIHSGLLSLEKIIM